MSDGNPELLDSKDSSATWKFAVKGALTLVLQFIYWHSAWFCFIFMSCNII